ncbi:MAG: RagB/SusD family nutrient uptake outer membrane protein [Cyclobacteriaceae bacterium]|nr:RagB/SusD family nutrient uptake outer membrane protein [Cyclobacteriaceae bacterium]
MWILLCLMPLGACQDLLSPQPVDRISDDLVIKDASSARVALTSVYRSFVALTTPKIVAGDLMADNLIHNGTFIQYLEISNKDLSASNASAEALWSVVYQVAYRANFVLEWLDRIEITQNQFDEISAVARFLRGYAYFVGVTTYGGIPIVTSTEISVNRNISRATAAEVYDFVEQDYLYALDKVPVQTFNSGDVSNGAVKAALARFYLYREDWQRADQYASEVISGIGSRQYQLESNFNNVLRDFSSESILEVIYTANDNPGTSTNFGLNNLLEGRREIIPSPDAIQALQESGGSRINMISFNSALARGNDNGWTVTRYGPFDNVTIFRLPEMYLIRAEARARRGIISGPNSAASDLNVIRERAGLAAINLASQLQALQAIENERRMEFCFEGHRWYDLKRTGRAGAVMGVYSRNWSSTDELWPIPLREIQNNPGLRNSQNPGY